MFTKNNILKLPQTNYCHNQLKMQTLQLIYEILLAAFVWGSVPNTLSHKDEVIPKPLVWIRKWWFKWYLCGKQSNNYVSQHCLDMFKWSKERGHSKKIREICKTDFPNYYTMHGLSRGQKQFYFGHSKYSNI